VNKDEYIILFSIRELNNKVSK